jgi:hypothetical protein
MVEFVNRWQFFTEAPKIVNHGVTGRGQLHGMSRQLAEIFLLKPSGQALLGSGNLPMGMFE